MYCLTPKMSEPPEGKISLSLTITLIIFEVFTVLIFHLAFDPTDFFASVFVFNFQRKGTLWSCGRMC